MQTPPIGNNANRQFTNPPQRRVFYAYYEADIPPVLSSWTDPAPVGLPALHGIFDVETDEPTERRVVGNLLGQLPLATDAVRTWSSMARISFSGAYLAVRL